MLATLGPALIRTPAAPQDRPVAPMALPGDPLRIVALGTSLTARATWPDALARALAACSGRRVALRVVAEPGADVRWGLEAASRFGEPAPDIVLIEFSANDADLLDGLFPSSALGQTGRLIDVLRQKMPEARIVLMTMNPVTGLRRHLQRPFLELHDAGYRRLSVERGVGLVDLAPRWAARPDLAAALPDGLHPDPGTATELMLPVLLPYLGAAIGATCPGG